MMAWLVLVSERAYLRPGEARGVKRKSLQAPVCRALGNKRGAVRRRPAASPLLHSQPATYMHTLTVCSEEDLVPSKTGTFDECVLLDEPTWMGEELEKRVSHLLPDQLLFQVEPNALLREWRSAVALLGLPDMTLYQLRHGGPSSDYLEKRRTLSDIQMRGRWRSQRSVARYTKAGLVQKVLHRLSPENLAFCQLSVENLEKLMKGMCPATLPA